MFCLKRIIGVLLITIMFCQVKVVQAEEVVDLTEDIYIFVHGLAGWGPDEGLSLNYWGGYFEDYIELLNEEGYKTYGVGVGPFSSNWDRACELYAYIKGGTVDYGQAHSDRYGHSRYGKTYQGIYPDWGQEPKRVHLIGHSMGGQTIRTLAQLLLEGKAEEREGTASGNEPSDLFTGGKPWITSITTIATPHDGTSLAYGAEDLIPIGRSFLAFMASIAGRRGDSFVFDFKLDQWGLKRREGESYESYQDRVWSSPIWKVNKDFSFYDLSIPGARELNEWVATHEEFYYFSFAAEETYTTALSQYEFPEAGMNPLFIASAYYIGSFTGVIDNEEIGRPWFLNDGLVSVISAKGPTRGTDTVIQELTMEDQPSKGQWNFLGILDSTDHIDIIGILTPHKKGDWYLDLAHYLSQLPD